MLKTSPQKIGLITKREIPKYKVLLKRVHDFLKKQNCEIYLDDHASALLKPRSRAHTTHQILKQVDLAVVFGGDGTLLRTARALSEHPVLILGINLGRVGFLAEIQPQDALSTLRTVFKGKYQTDIRSLLQVTISRKNKVIKSFQALNDAVINQGSFARLIDLHIQVSGRKAIHFRADGLIVSTPTGSTAHSLSAGGPIVHPTLPAFIITPLCPTSLANRSLVIPEEKRLKITLETPHRHEKHPIGLTLDGQENLNLKPGDQIEIQKSPYSFCLITLKNQYFPLLREKLSWGK